MSTASNAVPGVHTEASPIGWQTTQDGGVLSRHKGTATAVATGRRLAKRLAQELTVPGRDGTVLSNPAYIPPPSPPTPRY